MLENFTTDMIMVAKSSIFLWLTHTLCKPISSYSYNIIYKLLVCAAAFVRDDHIQYRWNLAIIVQSKINTLQAIDSRVWGYRSSDYDYAYLIKFNC